MRPLVPQAGLGHTTHSGRSGGRVVLSIHPSFHHCVRYVNLHSTLSTGVTREGFTRLEFARHIVSIAFDRRVHHPKARTIKGRVVEVAPVNRKLMVHADGHSLGMAPVRFELIPAALSVLVGEAPAGEPSAVVTSL